MFREVPWLDPDDFTFPDVNTALDEPNGLLAFGGDLNPKRLLAAYQHGIFPWYSDDQPIMWWSPNPRFVLYPDKLIISRSLKKSIKNKTVRVSFDEAFEQVIRECAQPRPDQMGTWITDEMIQAYCQLHQMGHAHSVEVWEANEKTGEEKCVGGLYGIRVGNIFCGESMFSRVPDASKIALYYLVEQCKKEGVVLIDCQVPSEHLIRLGAENIPRKEFITLLSSSHA